MVQFDIKSINIIFIFICNSLIQIYYQIQAYYIYIRIIKLAVMNLFSKRETLPARNIKVITDIFDD